MAPFFYVLPFHPSNGTRFALRQPALPFSLVTSQRVLVSGRICVGNSTCEQGTLSLLQRSQIRSRSH